MCFTARPRREQWQAEDRSQDEVWREFERADRPPREPTPILEERDEREAGTPEDVPVTTGR